MAKAFMSSFGLEPKSIISSVSADGAISAAPAPCAARAAISTPVVSARPAARDAPARIAQPAANTRRAPSRSERRPPSSSKAAEGDDISVEDPREVLGAEAEVRADLGQGHADDRGVHDHHELRERDQGECRPAPGRCGLHERSFRAGCDY